MTAMHSLWTAEDQKILEELVRKRGFADVTLGLRDIAEQRRAQLATIGGAPIAWRGIVAILTQVYDHIKEGRPLP